MSLRRRLHRPLVLGACASGLLVAAALAPAQLPKPPGGLDHFKCYTPDKVPFAAKPVVVSDQFGVVKTTLTSLQLLCNPVQKDRTKITRPLAHLTCYATQDDGGSSFDQRQVEVRNTVGVRRLAVVKPLALCVPALKSKAPDTPPTTPNPAPLVDHFRCYEVGALSAKRTVTLRDQFTTTRSQTIEAIRLCNPVNVNGSRVRRSGAHLVCYSIKDAAAFAPVAVRTRDRFSLTSLSARRPRMLCLPSFKRDVADP